MTEPVGSWADWSETAFGTPYEVWHDGLDLDRAASAYAADAAEAESMLLEGIGLHDALAPKVIDVVLRHGHEVPALVTALRDAHDKGGWDFAIASAVALYRATADDAWDGWLLRALREGPSWTVRIDAAIALREFAASAARIERLAEAVTDPDYLVRYHSGTTLLRYAGDTSDIADLPVFKDILDEPVPDAAERHGRAARLLGDKASALLDT
jgi:hypothetical protein